MSCKIVINSASSNAHHVDERKLRQVFGGDVQYVNDKTDWNAEGFDEVVVCGGDGTLFNAVNKCRGKKIFYLPCGTLNEAAHKKELASLGNVNGTLFCYVCATGSLTEIGYCTQNKHKKRWKALAYLPQVLRCYRCCEIEAELTIDDKTEKGNYTLLMVLHSQRCFGLRFNKDYEKTQKPYLLTVNSCGKDGLLSRAKIFFPLFRIFFLGAHTRETKHWKLVPFDNLTVRLKSPQNFCFDGEKRTLTGELHFCNTLLNNPVTVLEASYFRRKTTQRKTFATKEKRQV